MVVEVEVAVVVVERRRRGIHCRCRSGCFGCQSGSRRCRRERERERVLVEGRLGLLHGGRRQVVVTAEGVMPVSVVGLEVGVGVRVAAARGERLMARRHPAGLCFDCLCLID